MAEELRQQYRNQATANINAEVDSVLYDLAQAHLQDHGDRQHQVLQLSEQLVTLCTARRLLQEKAV